VDERFRDVKYVTFDLDYTLYPRIEGLFQGVRNNIYRVVERSLEIPYEKAKELFEANFKGMGSTTRTLEQLGIPDAAERVRDCLEDVNIEEHLHPDARLKGLLRQLKERYQKLVLISDSRKDNAVRKLNALGISDSFDYLFCWDTQQENKSNGIIFSYTEQRLECVPGTLAHVGDSEIDDIEIPSQRGWKTVHVSKKPSEKATAGIATIYDLERILL